MALITCPECGKTISDRAKICVHCGFDLKDNRCPECGFFLQENDSFCPNCGCPREETNNETLPNAPVTVSGFSNLLSEKTACDLINYIQFATSKVIIGKTKGLLEDEFDSVINNINPSSLQDYELIQAFNDLFNYLKLLKLNENQKEFAEKQLKLQKKNAITQSLNSFGSIFVPGADPATMLASVLYTGISSALNYKRALNDAEMQGDENRFKLNQYEVDAIDSLRSALFISAAKVFSGKTNNVKSLVSENEMKQFALSINSIDDANLSECEAIEASLEFQRDSLKYFAPYWLGLALCYNKTNKPQECLNSLNEFELLTKDNPVFKKNPYKLEAARIRISVILSSHTSESITDSEKDTIRECIKDLIDNTPTVQGSIDSLHYDLIQLYCVIGDYDKANESISYLKKRQLLDKIDRLEIQVKLMQNYRFKDSETISAIEKYFSTVSFGLSDNLCYLLGPDNLKELDQYGNAVILSFKCEHSLIDDIVFSKDGTSNFVSPSLAIHPVYLGDDTKTIIATENFTWNDFATHPYVKIKINNCEMLFKASINPILNCWPYSQTIKLKKRIDSNLSLLGDSQLVSHFNIADNNPKLSNEDVLIGIAGAALFGVVGLGAAALGVGLSKRNSSKGKIDLTWLNITLIQVCISNNKKVALIDSKGVLIDDFKGA